MEYLQPIITILSLVCACFAWLAKLRWSVEFEKAKNAIIQSKDAEIGQLKSQIDTLSQLNSVKLRESYLMMKEQLEEYIDQLEQQLLQAKEELAKSGASKEADAAQAAINDLEGQKQSLMAIRVGDKEPDMKKVMEIARKVAAATVGIHLPL